MKKMLNACILLKVVPTKADEILNDIRKIHNVGKAYHTFGRFDVALFVEVEDYKELRQVVNHINGLEGVRSTETLCEA
jgi:DNA-binding Lrp family transcriptional regulator